MQRGARPIGKGAGTAGVVEVAVRERDVVDASGHHARRLEARGELAQGQPRVHEQVGVPGANDGGVAGAATGKDLQVHDRS